MPFPLLLAVHLLQFTGPDGQLIEVNPAGIVSIRSPRRAEHFTAGIHCIIFTSDNKYLAVLESCQQVEEMLRGENHQSR